MNKNKQIITAFKMWEHISPDAYMRERNMTNDLQGR